MKNRCRTCAKVVLVCGIIFAAANALWRGMMPSIVQGNVQYGRSWTLTLLIFVITGAVWGYFPYVIFSALAELLENQEASKREADEERALLERMDRMCKPAEPRACPAAPAAPAEENSAAASPDSPIVETQSAASARTIKIKETVICPRCRTEQDIRNKLCENSGCHADLKALVPYYCGRCGYQGPYEGRCPECGSASKIKTP